MLVIIASKLERLVVIMILSWAARQRRKKQRSSERVEYRRCKRAQWSVTMANADLWHKRMGAHPNDTVLEAARPRKGLGIEYRDTP